MLVFLRCTLALALCLVPMASWAYPRITRPVTDLVDVLDDEQEADIAHELTSHRALTRVQIAALTVSSTRGVAIGRYALETARQWAGGNAIENNGVLYVLAVRDRRHHVEVGTGLMAMMPDDRRRMILDAARPLLRAGDAAGAVRVVVDRLVDATGGAIGNDRARIVSTVAGEAPLMPSQPATSYTVPAELPSNERDGLPHGLVLLLFTGSMATIFFMIVRRSRRSYDRLSFTQGDHGITHDAHGYRSWWNSTDHNTSSSSFFLSSSTDYSSSSSTDYSGGGGSFGGGGSSSDW